MTYPCLYLAPFHVTVTVQSPPVASAVSSPFMRRSRGPVSLLPSPRLPSLIGTPTARPSICTPKTLRIEGRRKQATRRSTKSRSQQAHDWSLLRDTPRGIL